MLHEQSGYYGASILNELVQIVAFEALGEFFEHERLQLTQFVRHSDI